jgi:V/A-type H+-transporting ATPase subunit A
MSTKKSNEKGFISAINGTLIYVKGIEKQIKLHDLIKISEQNILGEVIQIYENYVVVQCYENTNNLKLNQEVINLQEPLSMELAPGLLASVFDGVQRPLNIIDRETKKSFLERGIDIPSLSRDIKWHFVPKKKVGDRIVPGDIIGTVQETALIEHRILVPLNNSGVVSFIVEEGDFTIIDEIYRLENNGNEKSLNMLQKWPITISRPYKERILSEEPLITGIRVIDLLFPIAKGGTVAVPGGFGTGKTVIQQSLAKWCDADIIIFVGCGERGNEIADVLKDFTKLIDPQSGRPLIERLVLIANTSNMPVSAREASIFSGITIAEYYRDMGYDVAVLADSTSRWAESLREISGLLEEMPAEEGYPAYLPSKLSSFYERAGKVELLGNTDGKNKRFGSLTVVGSVSPPAGDFSEPVTATTKRFVQAFWALDARLAYSKHYPAINWSTSYSNYVEYLSEWWHKKDIEWSEIEQDWFQSRSELNSILSKENELKNIIQLIGEENLPDDQQFVIFIGRLIRESFLIQNAFDDIDKFTSPTKLLGYTKLIILLYHEGLDFLNQGYMLEDIKSLEVLDDIRRVSKAIPNDQFEKIETIKTKLLREIQSIKLSYSRKKIR